ncbi:Glycerol uptake facilitator (Major Intrinsic Protein Family) [Actinokineospora alba]|uniref:Glycerol uptake facilitator (Major Intrinsic Protein Family) n=1 Tax=Actinokineospora alba TaxID=504798 RepID=A0A1H0N7Y1_9PSEU|nr:glycerol uptake facilitator-like aquaporin [Actinokineospora alba]SDH82803.1 Glycerol uptake facilitator (Major Intrinsic Protein Family) [Actinokineospora alba]SDO88777.1 Glycerol uptake facilitator (Major Intrinsic Protein Family) [Actinokineospora alba]
MVTAVRESVAIPLARRVAAEAVGTGVLVATVVGSGIMGQVLAPDQVLLQLLCNAVATVAVLGVLIALMGSISGAHFNPAVTLADAFAGRITWSAASAYLGSQLVGGCLGTILAHAMFEQPLVQWTGKTRGGVGQLIGEAVATAGLLLVIAMLVRTGRGALAPVMVPAWILGAYFFTSSTSFANPAVTVGRALTGSFAGIDPASVPAFVAAQLVGAAVGVGLAALLLGRESR